MAALLAAFAALVIKFSRVWDYKIAIAIGGLSIMVAAVILILIGLLRPEEKQRVVEEPKKPTQQLSAYKPLDKAGKAIAPHPAESRPRPEVEPANKETVVQPNNVPIASEPAINPESNYKIEITVNPFEVGDHHMIGLGGTISGGNPPYRLVTGMTSEEGSPEIGHEGFAKSENGKWTWNCLIRLNRSRTNYTFRVRVLDSSGYQGYFYSDPVSFVSGNF